MSETQPSKPSLKERLLDDLKEAMKTKDSLRKDVIQIIRAGVLQIEKDEKRELDDGGVTEVITRELKKRNDVMPDYEKDGRAERIEGLKRQMELLKSYLPRQLSGDELAALIDQAVKETGASSAADFGKVMKALQPAIKGRADGRLAGELVRKRLEGI